MNNSDQILKRKRLKRIYFFAFLIVFIVLEWIGFNKTFGMDTVYTNLTTPSIAVNNLQPGVTYYWRVVAKDIHGAETAGEVWSFTVDEELPVELISFVYENNCLRWQTETEVNCYGFEVQEERFKVQGSRLKSFESIGFVPGSGNSNSPKDYSFLVKTNVRGEYNYRLKMIDTDGSFEYSPVVTVGINNKPSLAVYPNPFNSELTIEINAAGKTSLKIYSVTGELVADDLLRNMEGVQKIIYNASRLATGIYFLRFSDERETITKKIMLLR